jgi:vitamin B12 transporter
VHDLIDFSGGSTFQAINVDHAAIDGAELIHHWRAGAWSLDNAGPCRTRAWQRCGPASKVAAPAEARNCRAVLTAAIGERASAGVELLCSSKSADVGGTTLGGYALVNLRASYALGSSWKPSACAPKICSIVIELAHGYNTAGRSGYLTVSRQPRKEAAGRA